MKSKILYDITASIVAYNTSKFDLKRVIDSFMNSKLNVKLYISDNSPTNELEVFVKSLDYEKLEYIFNNSNGGYGKGHNIIIDRILDKSKYHIVLNPDIYFEGSILEEIFSFLENNSDIGNLMPMVKYPNGEIQRLCKELPSPIVILLRSFPIFSKIKENLNYNFEMKYFNYKEILNVPILSGCFMVLRNSVLKDIGGFDERFFMYFEDFDLNRRIHQKYKTIFFPKVEIIHEHAREAHKSKRMMLIALKSAVYYFNKYGWFFDKNRKQINRNVKLLNRR